MLVSIYTDTVNHMFNTQRTEEFDEWLAALMDLRARAMIVARIRSAEFGNLGDVKPVGVGVSEMRIHYGPGYRVYFKRTGRAVLLLLCAGNKSSQQKDIVRAISLNRKIEGNSHDSSQTL